MKKSFIKRRYLYNIVKISLTQLAIALVFSSIAFAVPVKAQEILDTKVSLKLNNVSLENSLIELEKTAQVKFSYNSRALKLSQKVNVIANNEALFIVLNRLLKPLNIQYFQVSNRIVLRKNDEQSIGNNSENELLLTGGNNTIADIIIKGTIADEKGEKLPGVNVTVKGSTRGTSTNANGEYSIAIPDEKAVLVFSFVGYSTQEMIVGNKTSLNIILKTDIKALDEVVVVGYGTQSRRNVTGSVARVDMKKLEGLPNTNISQALRGRIAGVQFTDNGRPGQGGNILIRGQRSISAGNNPLIVLDGIIFDGSLADINPGDIDALDVLKDASSTAIYGARAANGVILVTSKVGTTEKPTIRVNSYSGVSDWSYKPKLLTPERYIQKTLDWRSQAGLEADLTKVEKYLTATEAKNYKAGNTIDPWEVASQNSSIQNFDLSVSGRSNKTNYFISGNYVNERGLIFNDNATRKSVRVNIDNQITGWLKFGVNAQYSERDMSGNEGDLRVAYWTSPYNDVWADAAKTDPIPLGNEDGLVGSILKNAIIDKNLEIQRNLFANFYGIIDLPLKGLSFRMNYSPNYRWYNLNNFSPIYQRNGRNDKGTASRRVDFDNKWVLENILTYTKELENHHIDATFLYGRSQAYYESLAATGVDFTGASDANGWNNLSLAKVQSVNSMASNVDGISSMARLNYRFKDKYLVTLTARRDGSSVFGSNNKFGLFPSAAIAWIASEEPFLKAITAINSLKVRMSYGSVGNQAISAYQSLTKLGQLQYVYGDGGSTSTGLYPLNLPNSNLGWETTTTSNLAIDFGILKGRIGGTIEYYNMDTRDLLLTRQLPGPSGFASMLTNVGETNNKGFELSLNTININSGKFEWNSDLTFSTNKNQIVNLYRSDANGDGKEDDDTNNQWFIGQPISVAFDYKMDGVYQVGDKFPIGQNAGFFKMQDYNNDGKIDPKDRHVLGTLQPEYRWNFNNNFKYGRFNLMVNINALQGWVGLNNNLRLDNQGGNFPTRPTNFLDAGWWTPENKSNTSSSLSYTNPFGASIFESRDFIRIQEVSFSYNFPQEILKRLNLNDLKVYISGRNLYTFTKWQYMDPESASSFPTPRTVSFGLNLSL